ncbi:glycosyltransferase family 4 protein [Marinomonas polaris]|uniref:glycosyltransferase family 4 protein n=1 Tax=Marinomonas polaris TaxID=293552 RepID=UPI003F946701
MSNKMIILHDFDGTPYYKALEENWEIEYLVTRPFRFLIRDLVKKKKISKCTLLSIKFFFTIPFRKNSTIMIAMAPFNWRFFIYSILLKNNYCIYHSSWPDWNGNVPFEYLFFNKIFKKFWLNYLPRYKFIVGVTKACKISIECFVRNDAVTVNQIYHVVDCDIISDLKFNEKWEASKGGKFNIAFLGRLDKSKGIDTFIKISEKADSKKKFYVAGDGDNKKTVEKCADERSNFIYKGYISNRENVKAYLEGMHFLILPSVRKPNWQELFGVVIIEAMSQGVIVLTTDHVGPREIISDGHNGFILKEEFFISSALKFFTFDSGDLKDIAKNAILDSSKYSMETIIKEWDAVFNHE